jgi:hypothetical protein
VAELTNKNTGPGVVAAVPTLLASGQGQVFFSRFSFSRVGLPGRTLQWESTLSKSEEVVVCVSQQE